MKSVGLWALKIGLIICVSVGAVELGYADEIEHATKCTLATLKGQYLFAGSGMLFPPAFGVKAPSVANSAGYHIFNGDGTGTDFVTFVVNGINQNVPSPVSISYTLSPDCTGTYSVHNGPHFNIFVALDGEELASIVTDPGIAVSNGPNRRVAPEYERARGAVAGNGADDGPAAR